MKLYQIIYRCIPHGKLLLTDLEFCLAETIKTEEFEKSTIIKYLIDCDYYTDDSDFDFDFEKNTIDPTSPFDFSNYMNNPQNAELQLENIKNRIYEINKELNNIIEKRITTIRNRNGIILPPFKTESIMNLFHHEFL